MLLCFTACRGFHSHVEYIHGTHYGTVHWHSCDVDISADTHYTQMLVGLQAATLHFGIAERRHMWSNNGRTFQMNLVFVN